MTTFNQRRIAQIARFSLVIANGRFKKNTLLAVVYVDFCSASCSATHTFSFSINSSYSFSAFQPFLRRKTLFTTSVVPYTVIRSSGCSFRFSDGDPKDAQPLRSTPKNLNSFFPSVEFLKSVETHPVIYSDSLR